MGYKHEISKKVLIDFYIKQKKSAAQISNILGCSQNKVCYWLRKYHIPKRSISDAIYLLKNPSGDPFSFCLPKTIDQAIIFGLGIGLYWGEGSKKGNGGIKLTNSDPRLVKKFIEFLEIICSVNKNKLKFSLQVFGDISSDKAIKYWQNELSVRRDQFYKPVVSKIRGRGTYKSKSEYGIVIVHFNNTRLKSLICNLIEKNP